MNKIFAPFLPPWAETGLQPAFYDVESGTVLQQTARMYNKVNQLTRLFNEFSEATSEEVNAFEREVNETVAEYIEKFTELKDFVDDYFDNLDVQEEINNKIDDMIQSGQFQELISEMFAITRDITPLGDNLLEGATWTLGTGWVGDPTVGFIHASGNTETLTTSITVTPDELYVLKFTCTNQYASTTEQAILAQFGNSPVFDQYYNDGTVTKYLSFYPEDGNLVFTPSTNWAGNLTNIAIYKVEEADKIDQTIKVYDTDDDVSFAVTVTQDSLNNTIIGKGSMQYATQNSHNNTILGNNCLEKTASGYYNTAIGSYSQQNSIQGTRNTSVGFNSLREITYGDRNVGIGTFALHRVTSGKNNIGIGSDTAWYTTTGSNNIAISNGALNSNTTGSNNIALGYFANAGNTTAQFNLGVGHMANNYNQTGNGNLSIGYMAHYKGTNDTHNIAIGYQAMTEHAESGDYTKNIAIGFQALNKTNGNDNIAIGEIALKGATNATNYNVAIGYDTMSQEFTSTGENVAIGHASGRKIAGNYNVAIGTGALNSACGNGNTAIGNSVLMSATSANNIGIGNQAAKFVTTGEKNIIIGQGTGNNISTASNVIIIGNNLNGSNVDNFFQIGGAMQGVGSNVGLGGASHSVATAVNLPAGTATVAPLRFNAGTLNTTPVNGCMEFDGTHLYITINNSRVQIV